MMNEESPPLLGFFVRQSRDLETSLESFVLGGRVLPPFVRCWLRPA